LIALRAGLRLALLLLLASLALTLTVTLALTLGITLLVVSLGLLLLERADLGDELRDLVLLLIDLGAELVMQLLELAGHRRGAAVAHRPALGSRGIAPGAESRVAGALALPAPGHGHGHPMVLHPGAGLGQRHRHLDPQVDQLVQLLLHLVQLAPALIEVPAHPLLVVLQGGIDLLGELPSLLAPLLVLGLLALGRTSTAALLGQGRKDEYRRRQEQACEHATFHVRTPSLKVLKWDIDLKEPRPSHRARHGAGGPLQQKQCPGAAGPVKKSGA
jgi:hypothetical protein